MSRLTRGQVEQIVKEAHEKGERPNLSGADLREADLIKADLSEADLNRADLSRAQLSGADHTCIATEGKMQMMKEKNLPQVTYSHPITSQTEHLIATSALEIAFSTPSIWADEDIYSVKRINLVELDRIGGQPGHGSSQVFVASMVGLLKTGAKLHTLPLLLKVVENHPNEALKLSEELERYDRIKSHLPSKGHAKPIAIFPSLSSSSTTKVLWSEFINETSSSGLPNAAPQELRHILNDHAWSAACSILNTAYEILQAAHKGKMNTICYFTHYAPYLRLEKGWRSWLQIATGSNDQIEVFGRTVRNPLFLINKLEEEPKVTEGVAHLSCVHGDLHPRNILVQDGQKACLIDFEWADDKYHTIVDFVLMETILKFVYIPWFVSRADIVKFENQLAQDFFGVADFSDSILIACFKTISLLRHRAYNYLDLSDNDWFTMQYLLPLFFITMGLFEFASSVNSIEHLLLSAGVLAEKIESNMGLL
jgi:hypothetical protein